MRMAITPSLNASIRFVFIHGDSNTQAKPDGRLRAKNTEENARHPSPNVEARSQRLPHAFAVFDDEIDALEEIDVLKHIASYRDNVSELAFAD